MIPPADPPAGFNCRWDGRTWVYSRPPVSVVYPCGKCGVNRSEIWTKDEAGRYSCEIKCFQCDPCNNS